MVDDYSRQLGLRPFELGCFKPDGVLVTSRDDRPDLRFPIADHRVRYGYVFPSS